MTRCLMLGSLGLALLAPGCDHPPPVRGRAARIVTAAGPRAVDRDCPGGLLCEAPQPLAGWRIPAGCEPGRRGRYHATCQLPASEWSRVIEFFRSRYPDVQESAARLEIHGRAARGEGAGRVVARPASSGLLLVMRRVEILEVVAVAGEAP